MSAFYPQPAEQLPPVAVSVVIPIFNMAQYLRCCLDSVCGQTLRDIEIICVNDASPDNALEIIHEYMRQDDRVTLIDFPENQGTSKARNAGMQAARGEYLAFVDSDDTVDLDFLHLLYREACNNTDVEMVKGNFRIFERKQNKLLGITNNDKVRDSKFNFTCFWTAIYKREFLETFKNMVFVRKAVICARKIVFADDAFYNYTPSGIGNNMSMWKIKDNLELHHMIVDYANQAEVEQQRYLILFNACFNALCLLDTQEVQGNQAAFEMIMESLIQLYAKCRYPEAFLATVDRRSAYKLLLTGDFDALMAYLKKPVRARIAADLRLRVSKANGLDAGMKSHIPVISIIIPVWNTEPYLRRCLDSVVNQTLHDIEIICVNDASTDNSLSILNEYAAKDSRMRVVSLEKRSGESVARNTGLSMVQGEYIGSVDSDDAVDFDFYEKLYVKAQETRADIVKGNRLQTEYNGTTRELNINDEVRKDKIYFSWQWWTAIYKNTLIIENNINFPPELILNGDIVFLTKAVICAKNVETVDTVFYNYYRHENSVNSKILTVEKTISYIDSVKLIIDYINTIDMKNITREQYNYVFSENLIRCVMTFFRPVYWSGSEKETKKYCAEAVLKLYTKCKYHELLNERLAAEYPAWHKFFLSDDAVGLTDFLINNTYEKVIATNLRARLLAGSTLTLLERKPGLPAREARCAKPA